YWADALAPSVRVLERGQDRQLAALEAPVIGLLLRGGAVVAVHERGAVLIAADGAVTALTPWPAGTLQAVCNGEGEAVWAAMRLPEAGAAVGRVREDGGFDVLWSVGEPIASLRWRAEDQTLYASAPGSGAILLMQLGSAAIRRLATVPKGSGQVGGLAFDAQGGIWAALCDGWAVMRFTAAGSLDRVVGLPVPCATDLAFGGAAQDRLYVTTSRHSVPLDTLTIAPLSGRLLAFAPS
ncbi:MAG: SMP-30/gluconolactonase/LRE family protein, partial [Polaromonas sp.]